MKIIDVETPVVETAPEVTKPVENYIQIKKNIIIANVSDATGCGTIRTIIPFTYLNSVFGKDGTLTPIVTPCFLQQGDILVRTRSMLFQRQMSPEHLDIVRRYKEAQSKFKYKMVYDIDDLLWGNNEFQGGDKFHGIPSYNFASDRVSDGMKQAAIDIMKECDIITVSTEYLKKYIQETLGVTVPVEMLWNTVPIYMWGRKERKAETEDIKKPVIVFNESPTHYSNEKRMKGDLNNAWCDWFIKAAKQDEIELHVMGGLPWFFEEIKDKVKVYEWLSAFQYGYVMKCINPHFVISPLVPNEFNSSKSNIKTLETMAVGGIHIGTVFNDRPSPYDDNLVTATENIDVQGIDELIKPYLDKDLFNLTVNKGYKIMAEKGYYTESAMYINRLITLY